MKNRKNIWIHRDDKCDLKVCGEWQGGEGPEKFSKTEVNRVFKCIKEALEKEFPGVAINPWIDAKPGTLD
jgi:hypothetical protein